MQGGISVDPPWLGDYCTMFPPSRLGGLFSQSINLGWVGPGRVLRANAPEKVLRANAPGKVVRTNAPEKVVFPTSPAIGCPP